MNPQHPSTMRRQRTAVIIGAGPAGLTAALELLEHTDIRPIVLEATDAIGGLARTVQYKGNRLDIGGHRFFSKSERVNAWWARHMPCESISNPGISTEEQRLGDTSGEACSFSADQPNPDHVMLLRPRRSRIYFLQQFFAYPLALSAQTLRRLGWQRSAAIIASYAAQQLRPHAAPVNMQQFFTQRFGRRLYETFFKAYTEKVWGVPCDQIPARWGAQRIRKLSLLRAVHHQLRRTLRLAGNAADTSLCEQFLYPKLGPGQLWEHIAQQVVERGGEVRLQTTASELCVTNDSVLEGPVLNSPVANSHITCVHALHASGAQECIPADFVLSTMPVPALIKALGSDVPPHVRAIAEGLRFRDFLTVGLLSKRLALRMPCGAPLDDTWIYIQEPGIRMGRLQIFNNWSTSMVADPTTVWLGLEYFCAEGDDLWTMPDDSLRSFAASELAAMGLLHLDDVLDTHIVRVPKAYPAYLGTYEHFDTLRNYTDRLGNLFLIGRNGMHRYNNQDHSMLAAMTAVDQISSGLTDRDALWTINTEPDYHEQR